MTRAGTGGLYAHQALETEDREDEPRGRDDSGFLGSISQMLFSTAGPCKVKEKQLYMIPLESFRKERDQCKLQVLGGLCSVSEVPGVYRSPICKLYLSCQ